MDPLAELHDIHLPGAASWWPPAPGWLLLAGLVTIAVGFFGTRWLLAYRRNRYRRAALAELDQLAATLENQADNASALAEINALLKRVALRAYPRKDVAALNGTAWVGFLTEHGRLGDGSASAAQLLGERAYQGPSAAPASKEMSDAIQLARQWIRRHT